MNVFVQSALLILASAAVVRAEYDPLLLATGQISQKDLTVNDKNRSRQIPIRVYLPKSRAAAPVVLFSHGLGGNREGSAFLGRHWAGRGYVAVFLQHPGSDDNVWKGKPLAEAIEAMIMASGLNDFLLRVDDVPAVLDRLAAWNGNVSHSLGGRLEMTRVGMSGHSFGAVTTQAVSGQTFPFGWSATDPRIKAAIPMSPSSPPGEDPKRAFGAVKIPWMLLTGTLDSSPLTGADAASRLVVFPALPPGGKYQLILNKAEHPAFTDRTLPWDTAWRNPNHHRAMMAVTTAFWDAYLRGDVAAQTWLDGEGVRSVLETADQWERK